MKFESKGLDQGLARCTRYDACLSDGAGDRFKENSQTWAAERKNPGAVLRGKGRDRGRPDAPGRAWIRGGGIRGAGAAGARRYGPHRVAPVGRMARRSGSITPASDSETPRNPAGARRFRAQIRAQQPSERTSPQPKSVLRLPGPSVWTEACSAARTAASEPAPCAICRAASAVTIGAANEVPVT